MKYSYIITHDFANGVGVRLSLFISGCNFKCKGCFNKEQQSFECGEKYTENTEKYILQEISKDEYSGLSLLGGDPLWQDEYGLSKLVELCKKIHEMNKDIWIWSGFTWEEIFTACETTDVEKSMKKLIESTDVFVDGRFIEEQKDLSLPFRGSKNQRIIDVKESIKNEKVILYGI